MAAPTLSALDLFDLSSRLAIEFDGDEDGYEAAMTLVREKMEAGGGGVEKHGEAGAFAEWTAYEGTRGGKGWKNEKGRIVYGARPGGGGGGVAAKKEPAPKKEKAPAKPKPAKPTLDEVHARLDAAIKSDKTAAPEDADKLHAVLSGMTDAQVQELRGRLGMTKGGGKGAKKGDRVQGIVDRVKAAMGGQGATGPPTKKPPEKPKKERRPPTTKREKALPASPVAAPALSRVGNDLSHEEVVPDAARPPLSEKSVAAIKEYTGGDYGLMNHALRSGKPLTDKQAATVAGLKEAFANVKTFDRPVLVKREMNVDQFRDPEGLTRFLGACRQSMTEGAVAKLPGYTSTTSQDGWAFGGEGNVRMVISARQGLDLKPASKNAEEDELLLDDGTLVRVVKMETQDDPENEERQIHTIHLEQVLQGEAKRSLKAAEGAAVRFSSSASESEQNRFSEHVELGQLDRYFVLVEEDEEESQP